MPLPPLPRLASPVVAVALLAIAPFLQPLGAQQLPAHPAQNQVQQQAAPQDCPDPEAAGAPVVDAATARQHRDAAPPPSHALPTGERATPDAISSPAPGAVRAAEGARTAPCPRAAGESGLAADPEVLESLEPGLTELGRAPPNILREESTPGLQQLIDRAHGGSTGITQPGGGTRQVEGQPPALRDGSAPRDRVAPR